MKNMRKDTTKMLKRILISLLCATALISFAACEYDTPSEKEKGTKNTVETNIETSSDTVSPETEENEISKKEYFHIEKNGDKTVYYIYNKEGNTVFSSEVDGDVEISMLDDETVDICVGEGMEQTHRYYDVESSRFSETFSRVVAAEYCHVAYLSGEGYDTFLVIRDIYDKESLYIEEFPNLNIRLDSPILWAEFTEGAATLNYTYNDYDDELIVTTDVAVRGGKATVSPVFYISYVGGDGTCTAKIKDDFNAATVPEMSPYGENVKTVKISFNHSLKALAIPDTIEEIIYQHSDALETVIFKGSEEEWAAVKGTDTLPETVNVVFESEWNFSSYNSIFNLFRGIVDICENYDDTLAVRGIYEAMFDLKDEKEKEWFSSLLLSTYLLDPVRLDPSYYLSRGDVFGYDIDDINLDGIDEMILMKNNAEIIAIFSQCDGKPILLDRFWDRRSCCIDFRGLLHIMGSNGAASSLHQVCRIAQGGGSIETVLEYGTAGEVDGVLKYYKLIDGVRNEIDEAEYDRLEEEYATYGGGYWGPYHISSYITSHYSGLHFRAIREYFAYDEYNYKDLVADGKPMTADELATLAATPVLTKYKAVLDNLKASDPKWYSAITHFAFIDRDGDAVPELYLHTNFAIFKISYGDLESNRMSVEKFPYVKMANMMTNGGYFWHYVQPASEGYDYFPPNKSDYACISFEGIGSLRYTAMISEDSQQFDAFINDERVVYETEEKWLEAVRALNLTRAYWYEFTEENVEKYLPVAAAECFTRLNFSSYESFLESMRTMTKGYNYTKLEPWNEGTPHLTYDLRDEADRALYNKLHQLVFTYYPPALGGSMPADNAFAYAIKDLNSDGVDEIVFIDSERYTCFAVITQENGRIVFADEYINELNSGRPLGTRASYMLNYWENVVGLDLVHLIEGGYVFDLDYYRERANQFFGDCLEGNDGVIFVREDGESEYIRLWNFVARTPSGEKMLYKIKDLKYTFADINGDTVSEMIIDCGQDVLVLEYNDSRLSVLSDDEANAIRNDGALNLSPIAERWEGGISPMRAYEIAEEYWSSYDIDNEVYFIKQINNYGYSDYYVFELQTLAAGHYTPVARIIIHSLTGEIEINNAK